MRLTVTVEDTRGAARVEVGGDLDFSTAEALITAATELLARRPVPRHLHLDFRALDHCTSTGLAALITIHRQAGDAGVCLHLDHRPPQLERMLVLTGTLALLTTTRAPVAENTELG